MGLQADHERRKVWVRELLDAEARGERASTELRRRLASGRTAVSEQADLAIRQACATLASDLAADVAAMAAAAMRYDIDSEASHRIGKRVANVEVALARPHEAATIWTVTTMCQDRRTRGPDLDRARTPVWMESRVEIEKWLDPEYDIWEAYYAFALVEGLRPGTLPMTRVGMQWYAARDWTRPRRNFPRPRRIEAIATPAGCENVTGLDLRARAERLP